jgi:hypothetical protein
VHPLHELCQGRNRLGEWVTVVTEIGTYLAPSEWISIAPGKGALFELNDCARKVDPAEFDAYRWVLVDKRGNRHATAARTSKP